MKKITIPAIFAAVLLVGMTIALMPIQQAATVHTTLRTNIDTKPAVFTYTFPLYNESLPLIPLVPFVTNGYEGNATITVPRANLTMVATTTTSLVLFAEDDGDRQPNVGDELIRIAPSEVNSVALLSNHNETVNLPTGASGATTVDQIWFRGNLSGALDAGKRTTPGGGYFLDPFATVILNLNITRVGA